MAQEYPFTVMKTKEKFTSDKYEVLIRNNGNTRIAKAKSPNGDFAYRIIPKNG